MNIQKILKITLFTLSIIGSFIGVSFIVRNVGEIQKINYTINFEKNKELNINKFWKIINDFFKFKHDKEYALIIKWNKDNSLEKHSHIEGEKTSVNFIIKIIKILNIKKEKEISEIKINNKKIEFDLNKINGYFFIHNHPTYKNNKGILKGSKKDIQVFNNWKKDEDLKNIILDSFIFTKNGLYSIKNKQIYSCEKKSKTIYESCFWFL